MDSKEIILILPWSVKGLSLKIIFSFYHLNLLGGRYYIYLSLILWKYFASIYITV